MITLSSLFHLFLLCAVAMGLLCLEQAQFNPAQSPLPLNWEFWVEHGHKSSCAVSLVLTVTVLGGGTQQNVG